MIFNFLLITFPKLYQKYLDSEASLPSNSFFSFSFDDFDFQDMFSTMKRVNPDERRTFRGKDTQEKRAAFYKGLTTGVCQQLERTKTRVGKETGLVVVSKDTELEKLLSNMKQIDADMGDERKRDHNAEQEGLKFGLNLKLAKGLNSSDQKKLQTESSDDKVRNRS